MSVGCEGKHASVWHKQGRGEYTLPQPAFRHSTALQMGSGPSSPPFVLCVFSNDEFFLRGTRTGSKTELSLCSQRLYAPLERKAIVSVIVFAEHDCVTRHLHFSTSDFFVLPLNIYNMHSPNPSSFFPNFTLLCLIHIQTSVLL